MADRSSTRLRPSLRWTASSPEIHTRAASLFFSASVRSSPLSLPSSLSSSGFLAVAVMRLVVERHDVLHAHEAGHHALQHLPFRLQGAQLRAAALQQGTAAARDLLRLPRHEGVVVGDDDLGPVQVAEQVARHQFAALVVAVRVVGLQHAQPVADGQTRGGHEEAARESAPARMAHRVDGLPRDQHRHHGGLAGAGGELERQPAEAGICLLVGGLQALHELPALASGTGGNLGQPDHGLHRFDLTEERADVAELVVPPVFQEPRGLRGDPPLGAGQLAPLVHAVAHALYHPHQLILLSVFVGRPAGIIETQFGLVQALLAGGGDRGDERDTPAPVDDAVGGLPVLIEFPVPRRVLVGRVQDRLFEKPLLHGGILPEQWVVRVTVPYMVSRLRRPIGGFQGVPDYCAIVAAGPRSLRGPRKAYGGTKRYYAHFSCRCMKRPSRYGRIFGAGSSSSCLLYHYEPVDPVVSA